MREQKEVSNGEEDRKASGMEEGRKTIKRKKEKASQWREGNRGKGQGIERKSEVKRRIKEVKEEEKEKTEKQVVWEKGERRKE